MTRSEAVLPAPVPLFEDSDFAVMIEAAPSQRDLAAVWEAQSAAVGALTERHAAVLFRGFAIADEADFRTVRDRAIDTPAAYRYRSTPRTEVDAGIMTATEYPASEEIPLHCENAYQRSWPERLVFCCLQPAQEGGQTPIADMRAVTAEIDSSVVEAFDRRGVRYLRTYHPGFDLDWQTVFQTDDRNELARYCATHEIDVRWREDGVLHTEQTCQGAARHPRTGELLWFNQAHLFHPSSLGPDMFADLCSVFGTDGLPRDARFGDGEEIPGEMLAHIRAAHRRHLRAFDWQAGDVLVIDNMLAAHGRHPFSGPRRVLVSMGPARPSGGPDTVE